MRACAWLLEEGFEVFRNVSAHGKVDVIALDPETFKVLFIDVKTIPIGRLKKEELEVGGIKLLSYDPETNRCSFLNTV